MRHLSLLLVIPVLLISSQTADAAAPSKNEANLDREVSRLDRTAATPAGEAAVRARMFKHFGATAADIAALRQRGLSLGEIAAIYSLAGGGTARLSPEAVEQAVQARLGSPRRGWGEIAAQLKAKLGRTVSQVKKMNDAAHRDMKKQLPAAEAPKTGIPGVPEKKHIDLQSEGKPMTRGAGAQ